MATVQTPGTPFERVLEVVRDYAVEQPSFTCRFVCWELGMQQTAVSKAIRELLRLEIITEIEPRQGPYGAVYEYNAAPRTERRVRLLADPDDTPAADLAPARGEPVPKTRAIGSSGKPGLDHKRQENGRRIKRGRSTGYGGT